MIYFKACRKCNGDMKAAADHFGMYKQCIQCGYIEELEDKAKAPKTPALEQKAA